MKKILHPFTPEEKKKRYEGRVGWFSDIIIMLPNENLPYNTSKKMTLTENINLPYRSENGLDYRYFYPALEPVYRPFTLSELEKHLGEEVVDTHGDMYTIATVHRSMSDDPACILSFIGSSDYNDDLFVSVKNLVMNFTFLTTIDNVCGIEVKGEEDGENL